MTSSKALLWTHDPVLTRTGLQPIVFLLPYSLVASRRLSTNDVREDWHRSKNSSAGVTRSHDSYSQSEDQVAQYELVFVNMQT